MLPEFIPHFAIGPLLGLAANGVITILCLVTLSLYRHYRPLRSLFFFYLFLTSCFFGWAMYALQISENSILIGYRILYASLALLPACWGWFLYALFDKRQNKWLWMITLVSLILAGTTLFSNGPYFFSLPLEKDPVNLNVFLPRANLLRSFIQFFCLSMCLFYFILIVTRLWYLKGQQRVYLTSLAIGLLFWLLGGVHDALRSAGMSIFFLGQALWFASLWLSIFLTIAVTLHFRSLEQAACEELERLNRVKSKALNHLSHELKTPLSVIKGKLLLLRKMFLAQTSPVGEGRFFETIERQLTRLVNIQEETDNILRYYQGLEKNASPEPGETNPPPTAETVFLYPFVRQMIENLKQGTVHRDIRFNLEGSKDFFVLMDLKILQEVLEGLLKNAIENTPNEGIIRIQLEQEKQGLLLKVQDYGVGITEENQKYIFDGFFHTQETDLYASKRPYDFNAGGKGLDLLQIKIYGQHFNFELWMESRRCTYLPTDRDFCPGRISLCTHCRTIEDCQSSGGSTFFLSFPAAK